VALEAIACGATVISFDVGGMSDLLWSTQMKIYDGDLRGFVKLMIEAQRHSLTIEKIPAEFSVDSHKDSWNQLINMALKLVH
jgi:hypothetical protein